MKCIFVGETFAGKSSLLGAIGGEEFDATSEPTIGIDFRSASALTGPTAASTHAIRYKVQLWDCAGQIRFRSIVRSYYRTTHVAFVVFDLSDRASFDAIAEWVADVHKNIDGTFALVLIGNKCDLPRAVSEREICDLVGELRFDAYTATSAMTKENLTDAINAGLTKAHQLYVAGKINFEPYESQKFQLEQPQTTPSSAECCALQ